MPVSLIVVRILMYLLAEDNHSSFLIPAYPFSVLEYRHRRRGDSAPRSVLVACKSRISV